MPWASDTGGDSSDRGVEVSLAKKSSWTAGLLVLQEGSKAFPAKEFRFVLPIKD